LNASCSDCVYFEDQQCIDKVAFCAMTRGPSSDCCQEFKPLNPKKDGGLGNRFCVDCTHFERILGFSFCSVAHKPGIACPAFRKKRGVAEVTL
jgi:hypothetical protein